MKHQKHGRKFSRVKKQRKALLKNLLASFIIKEKIITTEAKAKELKSIADRIINKAKEAKNKDRVAGYRELNKFLTKESAKKLRGDFLKKFESRKSGYARVIKLGRRKGDSAKIALIEFI